MRPITGFWPLTLSVIFLFSGCAPSTDPEPRTRSSAPSPRPVMVSAVQRKAVGIRHQRSGTLRYRRQVQIYNQEAGRILALPVYEGDRVEAGELLVQLDDQLLQAERDKASARTRQARVNLQRILDLDERKIASQDELSRARTALAVAQAEEKILSTRLAYTRILAPFDGIITERMVDPGDIRPRHSHLLTIADPNSLITQIRVSELLLPQLHTDQAVRISIDALPGKRYSGRISRIHPTLDPLTHHGKIEIRFDPPPQEARAGQFVRVELDTRPVPRLLVPFPALRRDREGEYLFIVDDGIARRQAVRSGIPIEGQIEILDGIEAGQLVVTRGFLGLRSGKPVRIVEPGQPPADSG